MTSLLATTSQQYGPPKPPEARKIVEATGLLMILLLAGLVLLFVGWIALGVVRRRWIGVPGMERRPGKTRRGTDPWFEAGRRADVKGAPPPPHAGAPGEEPYQ